MRPRAGSRSAAARPASPRAKPRPPAVLPPVPLAHPAFLAALAVAALCLVVDVTYRIAETDFWQHLAVGREILRLGRVPTTQVWTWPQYGTSDVTPSWLFRVMLDLLYRPLGTVGLQLWRWLTILAAFGIAWVTARRMGAKGFAALVVVAWAALPFRLRAEPRPETLVAVLLAVQVLVHEITRRAPPGHSPWRGPAVLLPLLALVWANSHISYWLGLVVQAVYFLDAAITARRERARGSALGPLATLGVLSGALSFVNPGGAATLAQPFQYWFQWRHELIIQQVAELHGIRWADHVRDLLPLFLAGWPVLVLLRLRRHGLDVAEAAIAALAIGLSLSSARFVGNLAILAVPFVARDVTELLGVLRPPAVLASPWARAALTALLCAGGSLAEWRSGVLHPGLGISPLWRPLAACDFIERNGVRGRCFNEYEYGGYLLWRFPGQRDRLPFMDIHQTGSAEDRRLYAQSLLDEASWRALDAKYRFDWVLLNRYGVGGDRSLDHLDADSAFALVFLDDVAAVYVRRAGPLAGVAERSGYRLLRGGGDAAPAIAAMVADSTRRPALRAELQRLERESPVHATALSWEANLLYREGRLAEARETLRTLLAIDPDFPQANARLAEVALALGRAREAEAVARRSLVVDGDTDRTRETLAEARGRRRAGGPLANAPVEPLPEVALPWAWPRGN